MHHCLHGTAQIHVVVQHVEHLWREREGGKVSDVLLHSVTRRYEEVKSEVMEIKIECILTQEVVDLVNE